MTGPTRAAKLLLHCPWCGQRLPLSLRDRWHDELEQRGIDMLADEHHGHNERNSLALDLVESGDPRVLAALVELVERPGLANARGTLVHCLNTFNVFGHERLPVTLVTGGSREVAHEANDLIASFDQLSTANF